MEILLIILGFFFANALRLSVMRAWLVRNLAKRGYKSDEIVKILNAYKGE